MRTDSFHIVNFIVERHPHDVRVNEDGTFTVLSSGKKDLISSNIINTYIENKQYLYDDHNEPNDPKVIIYYEGLKRSKCGMYNLHIFYKENGSWFLSCNASKDHSLDIFESNGDWVE